MKNTIYIATHKFFIPPINHLYKPIVAGADFHRVPFLKDNTEDNISYKNPYYSELTALYWIWKHSRADHVGLVHYHRYFYDKHLLSAEEVDAILKQNDFIVPTRETFSCSVYKQYASVHYENDLYYTCKVIEFYHADYKPYIDEVLDGNTLYTGNMFVTSKELLDDYLSFLFPLLSLLETQIPYLSYSSYNKRVFGFLAERIFNIYLLKNNYALYEYPVRDTFSERKQSLTRERILKEIRNEKRV